MMMLVGTRAVRMIVGHPRMLTGAPRRTIKIHRISL
jgi:hypothetical protein